MLNNTPRGDDLLFLCLSALKDSSDQTEQNKEKWKMRWYFFWICVAFCLLLMISAITGSIVVFCISKSYFAFFPSLVTALPLLFIDRFASYLFPMDKRKCILEILKTAMTSHSRNQQQMDQTGKRPTITKLLSASPTTTGLVPDLTALLRMMGNESTSIFQHKKVKYESKEDDSSNSS